MKIRSFLALILLLGTVNVSAQNDGNNCNSSSSISHEAVRAGNYKDAYNPWKEVMKNCPTLRFYTYTDGFKILKSFLDEDNKVNKNARTSESYKTYFEELMATHDQRIKYIPDFQQRMKGVPSALDGLSTKALDYIAYAPNLDVNQAYQWLSEAANGLKAEANGATLHYYLEMSLNKLKQDESHKEQFVQDYLNAAEYVDAALAAADKETTKNSLQLVKDNLVAFFINSGAADCASLQEIYAPKVEENKTDLAYLKKVIEIMKMMKCTEEEAYLQASLYSYQIEPTAEAALGVAYMTYKKGELSDAIKYIDEAIDMEADAEKKADYAYRGAVMYYSKERLGQSRTYCQKALGYNPNLGSAYILIASLYAKSPKWSDEPSLNKCTYFLIIDKLQRAKAVDPSVAEEANKLIATYAPHTPAASDLFMLGYKVGDRVTIGGWIGESTTIR